MRTSRAASVEKQTIRLWQLDVIPATPATLREVETRIGQVRDDIRHYLLAAAKRLSSS